MSRIAERWFLRKDFDTGSSSSESSDIGEGARAVRRRVLRAAFFRIGFNVVVVVVVFDRS